MKRILWRSWLTLWALSGVALVLWMAKPGWSYDLLAVIGFVFAAPIVAFLFGSFGAIMLVYLTPSGRRSAKEEKERDYQRMIANAKEFKRNYRP